MSRFKRQDLQHVFLLSSLRGAIILAKLSIVPVRRGFWGNKLGKPHTVPTKVTGKCGSIWVRLIPAPRGTGIVSAPVPKKLLQMAGIEDCYTSAKGSTGTLGNFGEFTNLYRVQGESSGCSLGFVDIKTCCLNVKRCPVNMASNMAERS